MKTSLGIVKERMLVACQKAGRSPETIRLVAVTKKVDIARMREAAALGITDFGESYIQEARPKIEALSQDRPEIVWHMIGHVQGNKAKYIPGSFAFLHSVDRWELLEALDRHGKELSVLFEVNLSGEPQKHGTDKNGLRAMLEKIGSLRFIKPVGLMTVPPYSDDPENGRPTFSALRDLKETVNREFDLDMQELSMGMSSDFEVAIEEGATMIRVGTALFGSRV